MQTRISLSYDTISPDLQKKLQQISDQKAILEAAGLQLVSWAQAAFEDPTKRPLPWPARKSGSNPLLKKSRALQQSIRVASISQDAVIVGTDRKYAAYHQWGTAPYVIRPRVKKALFWNGAVHPVKKVNHPGLPARPFLPFYQSGRIMPEAQRRVLNVIKRKLDGSGTA
ncbi:phage virion morphogenesis protein [Kiritimatiellaeota bacterium B1221]|nr:phage virion morphogenesis protein [Kiritimatiellaeota bacterium B1221]